MQIMHNTTSVYVLFVICKTLFFRTFVLTYQTVQFLHIFKRPNNNERKHTTQRPQQGRVPTYA